MDDVVGDLQRRLANIVRRGVIHSVKQGGIPKCRVELGEIVTAWLPLCQSFTGANRSDYNPAAVGDPVTVLSEGGDLNNGRVFPGWNTEAMPVPDGTTSEHITKYSDGTEIRYNRAAHTLTITLADGGSYKITGNVEIIGNLNVEGNIASDGEISDWQGKMSWIRVVYNGHTHFETGSITGEPLSPM
ncbi:phage baseplate assembly protein V [Erwinia endophytica]|uniref:phage baseplate assembly protein V n=1 Tax=Erwinia endophytica TaxID=1563158 RepID=UPI001265F2FD|nr:phage baseplate assembly protein V [Erwinia endophytica]KAB8307260.1 phage baseplate assembly protein V [Erwinia endophytica]